MIKIISTKFNLCDHAVNSLDKPVLQSIKVTRRSLLLITFLAKKIPLSTLSFSSHDFVTNSYGQSRELIS